MGKKKGVRYRSKKRKHAPILTTPMIKRKKMTTMKMTMIMIMIAHGWTVQRMIAKMNRTRSRGKCRHTFDGRI